MRIERVEANKEHFRSVQFRDGLNIVVADRTEASLETDSRNGVGKTTLFQIIDFCLGSGSQAYTSGSLSKLASADWAFTLTLSFPGSHRLTVQRSLDQPGEVRLGGDLAALGLDGEGKNSVRMRIRAWTDWLGERCFGLQLSEVRGEYQTSFRRLVGHFIRYRPDAYVSPFETFSKQPPHQTQVDNAYLLGLDWHLAVEWQRWKDRSRALGVLGKRDLDELADRLGELDSRRVRVESQRRRLAQQVQDFEILPEYQETEERANRVTRQMQELANESTIAARQLELYRERLTLEGPHGDTAVLEVFREAGVVFGDLLVRSLEEVVSFHAEVAKNRHGYLLAEIQRIEEAQRDRVEALETLEAARRSDMRLLESHGALEDFALLQQKLGSAAALVEALRHQVDELREIRKGKAASRLAQVTLEQRTAQDIDERLPSVAAILEDFSETVELLYGESTDLVVDAGTAGYQFRVSLPREGSHGVGKVGILAYDVAIVNAWSDRNEGPGFLAHDSIIFDGVDERQIAAGIERVASMAATLGYQYILTINGDDLPQELLEARGVDVSRAKVMTLTDTDASGGLLGIRF